MVLKYCVEYIMDEQHTFIKRNEEKLITTVPYNVIVHIFEPAVEPLILRWFWLSDRTTPTFRVTAGEDRGVYKSQISESYETEIPQYFNDIVKGDFAFWRLIYWSGKPLALVTVPMAHGERAVSNVIMYSGKRHIKVPENFINYLDLRARSELSWSELGGSWLLAKSREKAVAKSWGLKAQGTLTLPDEFIAEDGDQVEWVISDIDGEPVALLRKCGTHTDTLVDTFVEKALKPAPNEYVLKSHIYKAYMQYAVANGVKPMPPSVFFAALERRGINKIKQVPSRGGAAQAVDGFVLVSGQVGSQVGSQMVGGQHA